MQQSRLLLILVAEFISANAALMAIDLSYFDLISLVNATKVVT